MMTRQKNSTTNGATYDQGGSAQWSQICLLFYTLLFWMSGFTLIFLALWALLDPRRSYVLDLVDFSEDEPLLKAAVYMCIIVGVAILLVGFIACCGAIKKSRCMLTTFVIFVALIFCAECVIGALAISYRSKFDDDWMSIYVRNLTHSRYERLYWVTPLIDAIQYYQQCCGSSGPKDYADSYWFKTNTLRGTRSFVPASCCKQSQNARSNHIQPVDPMCTTYHYYSFAFNHSVNIQGCHEKLHQWLNVQTTIFASVAFALAVFQMIGICLAITLFRQAPSLTRSSSLILLPPSATKPTSAGYSQITSNTS